ncbi:MAG: putative CtpA-like serine protease [candidate division WS2 bacterium ADurb.Bin280]|uniref:Putative CtpA-like serine protease n=1 Tax=candidate division WS2 bacterium ADurb.Bin280 TaxID=1852829 RepID=A0A1V5SEB5_9BACT|nr:MAG: putative CtpA-like serine protease [candidate division WS2 bacterium ADurb.Bin280]
MSRKKVGLIFYLSILILIVASGFIGYLFGNRNLRLNEKYTPELVNIDVGKPNDVNFSLFWEAYRKLVNNYVGEIDQKDFLYRAIAGSFTATNDPYTNFLPPEDTKEFENELSGELEGIGIRIGILEEMPAVIAPLSGSPAEQAGLKARDKILKIDDQDTLTLTLDQAVDLIRGKSGTKVRLTVLRGEEEKVFEVTRAKINVETVELSYSGDVAILAINEFGVDTKEEFLDKANDIKGKGVEKVVLDLRNNPGGLLDGAVDVASEFFENGKLIVSEEGKGYKRELKTSGNSILKNVKLVVLVNGGSASASEILAGAIKDYQRGKIIGEKTFGKGTVQQYENLSDGSSVKITIAKWLTPNGTSIDKNGIEVDIEEKEPDNALFAKEDQLVKRAIEELSK